MCRAHQKYMITREDVQRHIDAGTFFDLLMKYVKLTPHQVEHGRVQLEVEFPSWFFEHVDESSRDRIVALIRANAQHAFDGQA